MVRHGAHRQLTKRKGTQCGCEGSTTSQQIILTWTANQCDFISWKIGWWRSDWWLLPEIMDILLAQNTEVKGDECLVQCLYFYMMEVITANTRSLNEWPELKEETYGGVLFFLLIQTMFTMNNQHACRFYVGYIKIVFRFSLILYNDCCSGS